MMPTIRYHGDRGVLVRSEYHLLYFEQNQEVTVPIQVYPFPSYPSLQVQSEEPSVFVQKAFTAQPPVPTAHSSISKIKAGDIKF